MKSNDIDWEFEGDRLVCHEGGDGWTRLSEYRGRKLLMRRHLPTEVAREISEDFTGKVVWR